MRKIEQHGEENFAALCWMLERRWPREFSKPEVALNVGVQNNLNVAANALSNLELVVIRDLEYAGLRQREGYTHHAEESARDIEAQVVPEEVSGYLTRDGSEAGGQIISESQAAYLNQEAEEVRSQVAAMIQKYRPQGTGNGEKAREVEAEASVKQSVPQGAEQSVITHKAGDQKSQAFWRTLVSSDPEKSIVAKATATFVCRTILAEVLGYRAAGVKVEFSDDPVRLSDVLGAIDKLCEGANGWQQMQKKAGYI